MKKAVLFMIISTFSFSLMNSFVKYFNHIPTFEIVFFRTIGSLVLATAYILIKGIPILGNNRKFMMFRAFAGIIAMSLFFMSLKYLPVGTAVSLRYLAPIYAAIFAVFLLKERLKPIQWFLFLFAFAGVLVLKGFDQNINTTGLLLVLAASVFSGLVYVIIRKIGNSDHPLVIVNYFMFVGTIVGALLSINNWVTPMGSDWLLLLSLGVFGFFGQVFMTKAFQIAKTNLVAPLKYIEVIFTIMVGIFWFGDIYSLWSLLGILMIVTALITNVIIGKR
ncbi:EamA domain-containing membrane protein RarD [Maribacter spongiicola]|uniref:EamA domain-containing membrane protein RarD n=1 Tax=Maribacter spongiicola TaxID=1206753 RepID=A0A4R7K968_9FLAO|nr:DMT family transporter [Maribacter spongiicola]TDT47262.1 EamA domain-containing membrane protein RarD [Maribacter spongiicola]